MRLFKLARPVVAERPAADPRRRARYRDSPSGVFRIFAGSGPRGLPGRGMRRLQPELGLQPVEAVAAVGNRVAPLTGKLDDAVVAGALQPGDVLQTDDMAAMDPEEPAGIQALLDFADGKRAEELASAVEDGGVMGIGVYRDDRLHGQEMGRSALLDGKMA